MSANYQQPAQVDTSAEGRAGKERNRQRQTETERQTRRQLETDKETCGKVSV